MVMFTEKQQNDNIRYERKYFLESEKYYLFKKFLINNGYTKNYDSRIVNSIYYDTDKFKYFKTNIEGLSRRLKVRSRWYNDNTKNKIIEFKIKNGFLGKKIYSDFFNEKYLINETLKKTGDLVKPIVKISYLREYFISPCQKFRATVDNNIYTTIENSKINFNKVYLNQTILEFKYSLDNDNIFRTFINNIKFPFRFKKNSKYVTSLLSLKYL